MSDLTALKSWREGRHVSRADIDITIAGVADRIEELEAALVRYHSQFGPIWWTKEEDRALGDNDG